MAIKYYVNPKKQQTIAVLNGCSMDCINKIDKTMHNFDWCWCTKKYIMPDSFRAVVRCADGDAYDEELGKRLAKEKLMRKYYKHLDSRWNMFLGDLIELNSRVFETPAELEETT